MKVCKFGGTSMATASSILQLKSIIDSDATRKYVVVSAPGKRFSGDDKVTDMLYSCYYQASEHGSCHELFAKVCERYQSIIDELGLDLDLSADFAETERKICEARSADYAASRGEYFGAIIAAKALGMPFLDAAEVIKFNDDGSFNEDVTNNLCMMKLSTLDTAVIPGFYGAKHNGDIKTFSRGGSDITGAIIARAALADVYENWTDISGFMSADPRIVEHPRHIKYLSYKELRELSYMGASVLHSESIFPVKHAKIPINIRNTFAPADEGTYIVSDVTNIDMPLVTGIAGRRGFMTISIEKSMMNNEIGFMRRVLSIFEHYNVSVEHTPSGIDTLTVIAAEKDIQHCLPSLLAEIENVIKPDHLETHSNLALIATVGHGMASKVGTASRVFKALADNKINIRMIDQGSSELNIIVGVLEQDCENAIRAIYRELIEN